jgi:hypothetical protein
MHAPIPSPRTDSLLAPLLASLPGAAVSPEPPTALLPLLSPILRQRVQLLSGASSDPWLPLLCYDSDKVSQLEKVVKDERLEPHPVSGEVEVDWESEVDVRYKRLDEETLQALASLPDLGLSVRLVWCVNDEAGGGDGWRIGDVSVLDNTESAWGGSSISAAEDSFKALNRARHLNGTMNGNSLHLPAEDEDGDDDYWARYDNTPSINTPAPSTSRRAPPTSTLPSSNTDEDSYYAQYGSVQPALDNHDPDEAQQSDEITRELQQTLSHKQHYHHHHPELNGAFPAWSEPARYTNRIEEPAFASLAHPRASLSPSSNGSETVERLERRAAGREQNEVGIKQHIATSIKSLYRLARAGGIDREEFDRLVRTELVCLAMMDGDDDEV